MTGPISLLLRVAGRLAAKSHVLVGGGPPEVSEDGWVSCPGLSHSGYCLRGISLREHRVGEDGLWCHREDSGD